MRKKFVSKFLVLSLVMLCAVGIGGTSVSWMGTTFTIPSTGETDWSGPTKVDGFLVSVGSNALSKAGGNYTLTADVNFGASFGLLAPYFSARNNAASTGFIRMDNGGSLSWRNAANSADLPLYVTSANLLAFNGSTIIDASGVVPAASGGTGISSYTAGDTLYASGATTLSKLGIGAANTAYVTNGSVPSWSLLANANLSTGASVARSKLGVGDPSKVVINATDGTFSQESQLAVSRGGTNIGTYTTGDLLYASNSTTLSKLGIGATGQQVTVSGGVPVWGSASGTLGTALKTSGYTITSTDDVIFSNPLGSSITLTLPAASSNGGKVFHIRQIDATGNTLLAKTGGDTIQGSQTYLFGSAFDYLSVISNGSSTWGVLSNGVKVFLKRTNVAGTSISGSSVDNILPFATASIDTQNGWSTDTYTVQQGGDGDYQVCGAALSAGTNFGTGQQGYLYVQKNGTNDTLISSFAIHDSAGSDSLLMGLSGCTTMRLVVGNTIKLNLVSSTGYTLSTSAGVNYITIKRIN